MDIPTPLSNASFYPLLLSTLMLSDYTPITKTSFKNEYDYIIIGAGTAGSVVARRLAEDCSVSVLLLEAGPSPPPITEVPVIAPYLEKSYIDWNIYTVPQKRLNNREILLAAGKTVGGSSILSYTQMIRCNRLDYDHWNNSGSDQWSYQDVLPYFKKLEDYRVPKYFNEEYHHLNGPVTIEMPMYRTEAKSAAYKAAKSSGIPFIDANSGVTQLGFSETVCSIRKGRRCSSAKAYLNPVQYFKNLDIIANAFVTKIHIKDGKRASTVEFEFGNTTHYIDTKKEIIVSAGALQTPKLLMLSGIGPKETLERFGIPVVADLAVGQNLQDHPMVFQPYAVSSAIPSLNAQVREPDNILQFIYTGTGPLSNPGGLDLTLFKIKLNNPTPDVLPDNEIYIIDGGPAEGQPGAETVLMCCPQILQVRSKGFVTLKSSDPHDLPLVDPNYFDDPQDLRDIIRGLKFCDNFMNSQDLLDIGAKRFGYFDEGCDHNTMSEDEFLTCVVRNGAATAFHAVGTAKMGRITDATTVVDSQLRIKGIAGLRVVDASIMPQIPTGNLHNPVIMIAEKAADLIKNT